MNRFISVEPTSAQFSGEGGTKTFTVNASGSWKISSNTNPWIHLSKNDNKLKVRVDENTNTTNRSGSFELSLVSGEKSVSVSISQRGGVSLSVSPDNLSFTSAGGTQSITITTNGTWSIGNNTTSWAHLIKNGNQLSVRADQNNSTSSRTGKITVKAGNKEKHIDISQTGASTNLSVSSDNLNFGYSGGTQAITITTNGTWSISNNTTTWAHLTKSGSQLSVRTDQNNSTSSRTGRFTVKAGYKEKQVNITQLGYSANLYVSSDNLNFGYSGGTQTITITTNGTWSFGNNTVSWAHLTKNGNQISVRIDQNNSTSSRTGRFTVKADNKEKQINISQTGSPTNLSVSSDNLNFDYSGGTKTITVTTNGTWSIGNDTKSWVHLTKNGNQLSVRTDQNYNTASRSDRFTIKMGNVEKHISITQAGMSSTLSVSSDNLDFSSHSESKTLSVYSNTNWTISVSTASWGHLTKNGNNLIVRVDPNRKKTSRNDYFTLKAGDKSVRVNIHQSGRHRSPFNHAFDQYVGGFSFGYIQKQWEYDMNGEKEKTGVFDDDKYLQGIQTGFRIDPQFGAGFGMNTGLFYEYCWAKSNNQFDNYGSYHLTYEEHGLYMPLHLKFTMNFSKWFQLSLYGGAGLNYVISGKAYMRDDGETYGSEDVFKEEDDWKRFNTMIEYGASLRINALQFDFTMSQGLTNWSDDHSYTVKQGRPLSLSATICF